ncbi:chemotaxis protein CheW [Reichenbachiella agarivorans]|uniref:Chemotaxis protein CheW n=1 Tax=Reichenbachiella agarivorans TaxID=2979464 RepID=A0ABY6CNI4_9BACT|nr:chemotaxis protein CheW [Reichenbachiella agarivorans]UXP32077.1 chemotaxis protein CheW [Reichenbachiella agarivorans]
MSSLLDNEVKEMVDLKTFLTFDLEGETFGVEVKKVVEIQEMTNITKIPNAPKHMAGVQNLRGKILPLIDTKVKFGLSPIVPTVDTCIIVIEMMVEGEKTLVGTLVDAVQEVVSVPADSIQSSRSIDAKFDLEYVSGMFKKDKKFIMLLNLDKVFSLEDYDFGTSNEMESKKSKQA